MLSGEGKLPDWLLLPHLDRVAGPWQHGVACPVAPFRGNPRAEKISVPVEEVLCLKAVTFSWQLP